MERILPGGLSERVVAVGDREVEERDKEVKECHTKAGVTGGWGTALELIVSIGAMMDAQTVSAFQSTRPSTKTAGRMKHSMNKKIEVEVEKMLNHYFPEDEDKRLRLKIDLDCLICHALIAFREECNTITKPTYELPERIRQ